MQSKQAARLLRSRDLHIPFQNNKQTNRHSKKTTSEFYRLHVLFSGIIKNEAFQTKQTNQQQSKRNGFSFIDVSDQERVSDARGLRARQWEREHTFRHWVRRYSPVVEHISCFSFPHEFIHTQANKQTNKGGVCFEPDYFFRCRF